MGEELARLRLGAGAVILVEGGAGMGKTRLLDEAAAMASRMSFTVGRGVADPRDTVIELAPLLAALSEGPEAPFEQAKLRDLPMRPEQRYWLHQDLQTLLEGYALQTPLLLCIDDLHWADSATTAALRALLPRLAAVPVAWAIGYRPSERSDGPVGPVGQLGSAATRIVLRPLEGPAVAQVARDAMQAEPDDALLEMAGRARGSPFLLTELLAGLREEQLVRIESGRAELLGDRPPHRVSESMRKRLTRLSEPARRAATVAASLGRRFSFTELAAMLNSPPWALLEPVQSLIDSGLLAQTEDKLAFRHDLTRDAVRDSVPVSARRALDRQAANVLLDAGALPVEVAVQLAASAEPGDELAISTLLKAAEALSTAEPRAGAELARRALDLAPARHPLRGPLVTQAALLMHAAGQGEEAKAFADSALREALPQEQEAEVRLGIASMFGISPDLRADAGRRALLLTEIPLRFAPDTWRALLTTSSLVGVFTKLARCCPTRGQPFAHAGTRARGSPCRSSTPASSTWTATTNVRSRRSKRPCAAAWTAARMCARASCGSGCAALSGRSIDSTRHSRSPTTGSMPQNATARAGHGN